MSFMYSVAMSNAMLDAMETAIGASPVLKIRSGAPPTNEASADSGTVLATLDLPADWLAAAANRTKAKSGTWQDLAADAAGTAGHYRIYAADGVTCHLQGNTGATGSGASMELNNTVLAAGQEFEVTAYALTMPNGT